jgi:hypothetical protein
MGAQRRQHHRREEAKRQAGIDNTAMRIAQEAAAERQRQQIQSMRDLAESMTPDSPPRPVQSTLAASRTGVRTARSTRGTVRGLSKGLASLRIPLNIGGGAGGGLNIG